MILCVQGPRAHLPDASDPSGRFPVVTFSSPRCIHATVTLWDPSKDFRAISENFSYLDASGWYWGAISASEAHSVLQGASEGTFLIRDSSHPLYMLTLSVKTVRGPTNVRIEYSLGRFRLDSSSPARSRLQSFPDIPSLVQHYVGSKNKEEGEKTEQSDHIISPTPKECAVLLKLKKAYPSSSSISFFAASHSLGNQQKHNLHRAPASTKTVTSISSGLPFPALKSPWKRTPRPITRWMLMC